MDTQRETNMSNIENNNNVESICSWEDIDDLNTKLLRGIYSYGFETPSPIQKKAIIPLIQGKDIIGQAQSGTGKTGAFCIGTLATIDVKNNETQIIIMSPTRELSKQNFNVLKSLSSYTKIRSHLLIGGNSTEEDVNIFKNKEIPQIIVGTPGRIQYMFYNNHINPKFIKRIILDEADEMLSSAFKEQVYNILQFLNNDIQIGLFSATMPEEVKQLTEKFMIDPIKIYVNKEMLTLEGLSQYYIALNDDHDKYEILKDLFKTLALSQTIIYCNSIKRVQHLYDAMKQDEFPVVCIHSAMTNEERMNSFNQFKSGKYRVLISSDVTARGIDVQQVSIVINFDICKNVSTYLHRIGRSARWGRKGIAINFVTKRDVSKMKEIETFYSTIIEELPENFADSLN